MRVIKCNIINTVIVLHKKIPLIPFKSRFDALCGKYASINRPFILLYVESRFDYSNCILIAQKHLTKQ